MKKTMMKISMKVLKMMKSWRMMVCLNNYNIYIFKTYYFVGELTSEHEEIDEEEYKAH